MNFIITILLFAALSAASFFAGTFFTFNKENPFEIFGWLLLLASIASIFVMFFRNMEMTRQIKEEFNSLRINRRKITQVKDRQTEYKALAEDGMMKIYPEFERDIFNKVTPNDKEGLKVFIAKYPELEFGGILTKYIQQLSENMHAVHNRISYKDDTVKDIIDMYENNWYIFKTKIPADVQKDITEFYNN